MRGRGWEVRDADADEYEFADVIVLVTVSPEKTEKRSEAGGLRNERRLRIGIGIAIARYSMHMRCMTEGEGLDVTKARTAMIRSHPRSESRVRVFFSLRSSIRYKVWKAREGR